MIVTTNMFGDILSDEAAQVVGGLGLAPAANIGEGYVSAEAGVGPVDASLKAIQRVIKSFAKINLREFGIEAVTGGSDAAAEVIVKVSDERGNLVSAKGG